MIRSLRRLGEGGESEVNPEVRNVSGRAGNVLDLTWRGPSKELTGKGTCKRLRVDLDRWCLTTPAFWDELEGRVAGWRFALFGRAAMVIAGVRTGEAGIGVNGVKVNGEVRLGREERVPSALFCVCALEVGCSESNWSREPERLLGRVDDAGIE